MKSSRQLETTSAVAEKAVPAAAPVSARTLRGWALRLIGIALFVLVLSRLDFGHSLALLRRADPVILAVATLLIFPMMALKTVRWRWLQRAAGLPGVSFTRSLLAYFTGMYAGLITPGRVGELVRVQYLTRRGAPLGPAFSTVIWDRVIDVAGLFLLGVLALWPLASDFRVLYLATLGITFLVGLLIVVLVWKGRGAADRLGTWSERFQAPKGRLGEGVRQVVPGLLESVSRLGPGSLAGLVALTLFGWVIYYFQAWLLARTLGIEMSLLPLVVCVTTAAIVALIPVSISGLGTRDAAMVVLFQRFGYRGEEALALSAVILLMLMVNAALGLVASQLLEIRPAARPLNP